MQMSSGNSRFSRNNVGDDLMSFESTDPDK